jgi:Kdo2-lipid IVA lauroyltransferase/acyltransferase
MFAYLQYLALRGFGFWIGLLPERVALWAGRVLGRAAYHLDRERREVALQNLRIAFGHEKTDAEIREIALKVFQNLGMTTAEFFRIPNLDLETFRRNVEFEGVEVFKEVLNNTKKGGFLLLSHFGNWELMAMATRVLDLPISVIAKPIKKNRWVDHLVTEIREGMGMEIIPAPKASRRVLRALSENRLIGILIDQRAKRSEGVWSDFFGKKAPTTPALSILAMRTGTPVIPVFMVRNGNQSHRLIVKEPLKLVETGDLKRDIAANTQLMNDTLEAMIRRYPDQWFWVHRRWERKEVSRR